MTSQTADYRVLDERLNGHSRRLEILEENHKNLARELSHIRRLLFQIKWIAAGVVLTLLAQEFGVLELLKRFF